MSEVNAKQWESMSASPSRGGLGLTSLSLLALAWGTACIGDSRSLVEDPGLGSAIPRTESTGEPGEGVAGDASQPPQAEMNDGSEGVTDGAEAMDTDSSVSEQDPSPATEPEAQDNTSNSGSSGGVPPVASGGAANSIPGSCTYDTVVNTGKATYYPLAKPLVNCGYETPTLPTYYVAINEEEYAASATCGQCVEITHAETGKQIQAEVTDRCPYEEPNLQWCFPGSHHLDLSIPAFEALEDPERGVFPINWRFVPCGETGNVTFQRHPDSNEYWFALRIRDHQHAIVDVEVQDGGSFRSLVREEWNYWTTEEVLGDGPFTVRVTDAYGNQLVENNLQLPPGQEVTGSQQFPVCN